MPLLSDEDVQRRLDELANGWQREGDALTREFRFEDFSGSVDFVDRLTPVANEMNHHPDLWISWNKVRVSLTTHSEGGITENDFELAARLDRLA
jgi:4a-hydroxytetrahydrobiopterin dehydratase